MSARPCRTVGQYRHTTSSEENSWDNRESIHVCQADSKLFPLAQEWRNAPKSAWGQKKLWWRRSLCLGPIGQGLLVSIIALVWQRMPSGCGHASAFLSFQISCACAFLFPLKYPFEAHMFRPPQLVFILVQSEGCSDLGSFTGRY